MNRDCWSLVLLAAVTTAAAVTTSSHPHAAVMASAPAPPAVATAVSPGHTILKRDVGTWRARIERAASPGGPLKATKGTEVNTLCCGGLFLLTDLNSSAKKRPFSMRRILGYDPVRDKYISATADSTTSALAFSDGDYDPATVTLTFQGEGGDAGGVMRRVREVLAWEGRDRRTLTIYTPGPDGQEAVSLRITYRRRN
jgi:hypothetical protein